MADRKMIKGMKSMPGYIRHNLKILPIYFEDVLSGKKSFELRKDDRYYNVGDMFILREWDPDKGYTGRDFTDVISYIIRDCPGYGLMDGYVIFGWQYGKRDEMR